MSAPAMVASRAVRRAGWPKRRQWLDRISGDVRLTSGAKDWLLLLASRSDDAGKPVWGNQVRMGERIGRCDRSVRRYRAEAEALGYVAVYRSKPERGPCGRWTRRKANSYYLRVPPAVSRALESPRRRQRASYCVVASHTPRRAATPPAAPHPRASPAAPELLEPPVTVLADSDDRSSPCRGAPTSAGPPTSDLPSCETWGKPSETARGAVAVLVAEMRATLRGGRR